MTKVAGTALGLVMTLLFAAFPSHAADWYSATTGSDVTGDGSLGNPWRTVNHGIANMQSGDILWLRGGTYAESIGLQGSGIPGGTSWATPTTIRSYLGETATLQPLESEQSVVTIGAYGESFICIRELVLDASFLTTGDAVHLVGDHVCLDGNAILNPPINGVYAASTSPMIGAPTFHQVTGNYIAGSGRVISAYGIYFKGADNVADFNWIENGASFGIHVFHDFGGTDRNVVSNNTITLNGRGAFVGTGDGNWFVGNTVMRNRRNGVQVDYEAYNTVIDRQRHL